MTKRYILLTAIICAVFSQQTSKAEAAETRSPVKINDHFGYTVILPADISTSSYAISSGGFYKLSANATSNGTGAGAINISGDQTIVDLNGAAITASAVGGIAINVANDTTEVTIKNGSIISGTGSNAFTTAIQVGTGVSRLRLENLTIEGCVDANGAIKMVGGSSSPIVDVTLEDVRLIGGTAATAAKHINGRFIDKIELIDVHSSNGANTSSGEFTGIYFRDTNSIRGSNVSSSNHTGIATTVGMEFHTCNSIEIHNLDLSNNDGAAGASTTGIKLTTCNNTNFHNVHINDLADAKYGAWVLTSTDVHFNEMKISNCASGTSAALTAVLIDNSQTVKLTNSSITNNTGTTTFTGVATQTAGCKDLKIENCEIKANTASAGSCYGVHVASTLLARILHTTIAQNDCSSTADSAYHVRGIYADGTVGSAYTVANLHIDDCIVAGNTRISTATNATSTVSGIWVDSINGCSVTNTSCNYNEGSAQAFGFYVVTVDGLIMKGCEALGNAAGTTGSGHTGGIAQLPSAGLYLWKANSAHVEDCSFIYNRSGNQNEGNGPSIAGNDATTTITVATCCGGFGMANVGTSTSVHNVGNTFINCTFKRNGTQIDGTTLTANGGIPSTAPQYSGSGGARRCWESEAIAAGSIEENTDGSSYSGCLFEANGISQFVPSYGICISNGTPSKVEAPQLSHCKFARNGFYGIYDDNATTTVVIAEGCSSMNNGNTNTVAVATTASETTRNWNVQGGTSIYQSLANDDRGTIGVQANDRVNYNFTSTAAG